MIIDYRNSARDNIDADLCIIGAGAAGLAIATRFLGSQVSVCIIESGGLSGEEGNQALYDGSSIGAPDFDPGMSRMRVFGGTCNLWGGGCVPHGEMHARDWVPNSGWPISFEDLKPYYAQASVFCGIDSHRFVEDAFLTRPAHPTLSFDQDAIVNKVFVISPVVFGAACRTELDQARNIHVLLHANLLELQAACSGNSVRHARIGSLEGRSGLVRAKHYVLACGGIENARLLLLSNSVVPQGLGNKRDMVGRFFMDHPSGKLGTIHADHPQRLTRPYDRDLDKTSVFAFPEICLSAGAQQAHRILSGRVRPFAIEGPVPKGIHALREFKSTLQLRKMNENSTMGWRLSARKNGEPQATVRAAVAGRDAIAIQVLRVGLGIGDIAKAFVRKLAGKPAVKTDHIALVGYFEQTPNPDSRIVLGEDRDALGQRKVCVDWRLTPLDTHTYRTAAMVFGTELAHACNGRFQIEPWLLEQADGTIPIPQVYGTSHHLGTTRMADDPTQGVVDRQCKVHGIDNLHVAGGSVFPTAGWAYPTFTIIALSLRLADHLRSRLELASQITPIIS